MYKPRKKGHGRRPRRPHKKVRSTATEPLRDIQRRLVARLIERGGTASISDLHLPGLQSKAIGKELERLHERGVLEKSKKKTYTIRHPERFVTGTISFHPRGFAFVSTEDGGRDTDLFVAPGQAADARHGDTVLVEILGKTNKNPTARVLAVTEQASGRITGTYFAGRPTGLVVPADANFPYRLVIRQEHSLAAPNNSAVLVEMLPASDAGSLREGRIIEILGDADTMQAQTEMVIRALELPSTFSSAALREARQLDRTIKPGGSRLDLRDIPHITIDGETARDFDDAVALLPAPHGQTLYVSIADVGHYVRPGSALDIEAYQRGTSVYFPDRVLPMLPEELSNDLCSLVPGEDRHAFTAILDFSDKGELLDRRFTRSVIRSRHRMTYTAVKEIVVDRDEKLRQHYHDITDMLDRMAELGRRLEEKRRRRGCIGFEIPEAQIILDEEGHVADICRRERNQAHKIIEEFMLSANEAVAETIAEAGDRLQAPFLYRIHEAPDPQKLETFREFTDSLGLTSGETRREPAWFGAILDKVVGTPRQYIISNLMLRVMQQARYSPENAGHFGLAANFYTHFTSPIRRYPDLVVHRALATLLGIDEPPPPADGVEMGEFLSKRERVAVDAERETMDRAKVLYLADRIGETFEAIVSGVSSFGLFVELLQHYVSGAITINDLADDYYTVDEKMHRLVGQRSGRTFQIGDQLTVRLVSVDRQRRHCNFVIEEDAAP